MAINSQVYNFRPIEPSVGISQAVLAGDYLFLSGCLSWDMDRKPLHPGDWGKQIETIYAEIDKTLKAHGLDNGDIVKETIFCRDIKAMSNAGAARMAYYRYAAPPASTIVEVSGLPHDDLLLGIDITAYRNR